jgi:murein L,D-transpeptidase YafK
MQEQETRYSIDRVFSWKNEWKTDPETKKEMNFHSCPMLTNGKRLYVFGRCKCSTDKDASSSERKVSIVVQVYDIKTENDTMSFVYTNQVTLMKNQFDIYSKESNNINFLSTNA